MLEAEFLRILSNDRIFLRVYESAGGKFDQIRSKDRRSVAGAFAKLLLNEFLAANKHDLRVFSPDKNTPLRVDSLLLRPADTAQFLLPATEIDATKCRNALELRYAFLSQHEWSVRYETSAETSKAEADCLKRIAGWSLCFKEDLVQGDVGQVMDLLAKEIARGAMNERRATKRRGRPSKVEQLAPALGSIYPEGIPRKPIKEIERDLRKSDVDLTRSGVETFSETTLREAVQLAIDLAKTDA